MEILIRSTSMQKFKSKFVDLRLQKKDKFIDLDVMNNTYFQNMKFLSDVSFFYRPEYTEF
jgi:hypothetical protein